VSNDTLLGLVRRRGWRNKQDRRCTPTTAQIGSALVVALASTAALDELTHDDPGLVGKALVILSDGGFDLVEALATLRRVQGRLRADAAVESVTPGAGRR
jgi:hypothetical protein